MKRRTSRWQQFLLALGILALIFLLVEIGTTLAATQHGNTPARVEQVQAGPYRFIVSLYDDPARAGFALPFAIAPQGAEQGSWSYQVTSVPVGTPLRNGQIRINGKLTANPIRDSVSPDPRVPGGVQGDAEITVQGPWNLHVVVDGPLGQQSFDVPVTATTLPAIPTWLGWFIGFIPVYGIAVFLWMQAGRRRQAISPTG
ncbi:MAG TPA: hypothetical protein VFA09_25225 [Ktedonobacteraceae bacterium]|jgi:hypothetical protein|nr:hypothetical protein [Ktedonobacteraceae bacterium]